MTATPTNALLLSLTRKRTCIDAVDPRADDLIPLLDRPSSDNIAFAPALPLANGRGLRVSNDTSPLDGWDLPWIFGQLGETDITEAELRFREP